ncbi:MAG: acetamidase/formamidase family protein [Capsulimonadales bacterium]|nr:acetamidase/formamidase family protein [Capsulimonadales bacterium]
MSTFELLPERPNLHGHFSRDLPPILTVDSGDTVVYRTLDAMWSLEPRTSEIWDEWPRTVEPRDPKKDAGHCLIGPVAVRGALPGMTLEIRFEEIVPERTGWTFAGGWDSPENMALGTAHSGTVHLWELDRDTGFATNRQGQKVRIRPFLGVIGNAPDLPGIHDTAPPRFVGGNMDCRELVAGSRLFLPVAVAGAHFSLGDGHGVQGDGEVSGTSIEIGMERVVCTFILHPGLQLPLPRAETPAGLLTFGFHEDLNTATFSALNSMLDWMTERFRMSRSEALSLASLVVDLRITQIVNGVRGVHALLPNDAIPGLNRSS